MSWFNIYRPKQIKELDSQEVRNLLLKWLKSGKFPQVFLFAGPRGTGKTSTARIIGALLNNPANEEAIKQIFFNHQLATKPLVEPAVDDHETQLILNGKSFLVQEMDAASHRGIDDIRQLKSRIELPPAQGLMTVYILDEVHMLTNEAFNALLKLLEEPPAHVVFILATTELHQVPATIISRCSVVNFRQAQETEIVDRLKIILTAENIKFQPADLIKIAKAANGSFRDGVKMLELAVDQQELLSAAVQVQTGGIDQALVNQLLGLVVAKDQSGLVAFFAELRSKQVNEDYFYQLLFQTLHQIYVSALSDQQPTVQLQPNITPVVANFLLKQLLAANLKTYSPINFLPLEILLIDLVSQAKQKSSSDSNSGPVNQPPEVTKKNVLKTRPVEAKTATSPVKKNDSEPDLNLDWVKEQLTGPALRVKSPADLEVSELANPASSAGLLSESASDSLAPISTSASQQLCQEWEQFLTKLAAINSSIAALVRSGQPIAGGNGTATVEVYYQFHLEQLQQPKFKKIIEDCGCQVLGQPIKFDFVLGSHHLNPEMAVAPAQN